jgi:predicted DCC family thiol-disulfide oxidoreductase YuxK
MNPLASLFRRRIDSQAVGAFRIASAAAGLFYVTGAIQLVDVAWPAHQALFTALYAVWLCVLGLLLAGFQSRPMAIANFILTLVCNSNPMAGAVGELMWRIGAFALMFMDSGASLSVDELRARWRGVAPPADQPRWPVDLAVLGLGVALMLAGLPKIIDPMWRKGDGFYLAMLLPWTHHAWADGIAGSRALTLINNYVGIVTESGFVFLVFVPYVRWLGILLFIGLMAGFGVLMSFYFIGAAGIMFLPLMLPDSVGQWPWHPRVTPLEVLYDGACGFCDRSVRVLRTMDVWNRLTPRPIQDATALLAAHGVKEDVALDAIHVVEGDRLFNGFYAVRRFAWTTPYLLPIAPLLYIPGIPAVGERIYASIAKRRYAISCAIGGPKGLPTIVHEPSRPPGILARLVAAGHLAYILVFAMASIGAVFGSGRPLDALGKFRPTRVYNRYTNDIRPLPLFCEVHLFGVFVYRLQGLTSAGTAIPLLPVFNERGGPGPCCVAGPRYLEGLMFHVTDDAIRMAADPAYRPDAEHMANYRALVEHAARSGPPDVTQVRMFIKVLNPPRQFEGRVAPWDAERWVRWLEFDVHDGHVTGDPQWVEMPPRPAYTVRS